MTKDSARLSSMIVPVRVEKVVSHFYLADYKKAKGQTYRDAFRFAEHELQIVLQNIKAAVCPVDVNKLPEVSL